MSAGKTDEINSVDCTNANFLALILYYNCARCYYWKKLGEDRDTQDLPVHFMQLSVNL